MEIGDPACLVVGPRLSKKAQGSRKADGKKKKATTTIVRLQKKYSTAARKNWGRHGDGG